MTADDAPMSLPRLPAAVRTRVVALAADALGGLTAEEVPAPLRSVARFAPARRARAGAAPLASTLEGDPLFRQRVAGWVRGRDAELAAAVDAGVPPPAAPPVEVAALTYLLRPEGWAAALDRLAGELDDAAGAGERADLERRLAAAAARLDDLTRTSREAADRARAELSEARAESAELRRRLREAEAGLGRARAAEADARRAQAAETAAAETASATGAAEARRLRARLAEAEDALDAARRSVREGRGQADVRLRLLLDTVVGAAHGLRQELGLPPAGSRPADDVAAALGERGPAAESAGVPARALAADDPAVLDQLLALPQVHLVVDGYNVTKSGYGDLPLATQRSRLLTGLAALAARTGAEVTCVFDGAALDAPVPSAAPRGVRVLFSPAGMTADEVVRRLVRAEPAGRPVVVVSSDREVAEGVARAGARPVASAALLRRLDRG